MADSATTPVAGETAPPKAAPKSPKKKATSSAVKNKKPVNHPKYSEIIQKSLVSVKERDGSSRQSTGDPQVHIQYKHVVNQHLNMTLRAGIKNESLKHTKGFGASGSFRLGAEAKKDKKPKVTIAKMPMAEKKPAGSKAAKSQKKAKKPASAKGRHNNVYCFYLAQNYFKLPRQIIRVNANFICLFPQDLQNLNHIFDNHVESDMARRIQTIMQDNLGKALRVCNNWS